MEVCLVREWEECTLNTAPALREAHIAGWVARASGSETRRANSATALYADEADGHGNTIARIEAWYRQQGQPPIFRLTPLSPAGFDEALAARGYDRVVTTAVMCRSLAGSFEDVPLPPGMKCVARGIAEGTLDLHRLKGTADGVAQEDAARQSHWRGTQVFLSLRNVNGLVATGLGRLCDDRLGLFNVHTAPGQRRRGFGAVVTRALLKWGQEQGAQKAFLQVEQANTAAVALYEKQGFAAAYCYWHRIRPLSSFSA